MKQHLIISGDIGMTLKELVRVADKFSYNKCRMTARIDERPVRVVPLQNAEQCIMHGTATSYEPSHCIIDLFLSEKIRAKRMSMIYLL